MVEVLKYGRGEGIPLGYHNAEQYNQCPFMAWEKTLRFKAQGQTINPSYKKKYPRQERELSKALSDVLLTGDLNTGIASLREACYHVPAGWEEKLAEKAEVLLDFLHDWKASLGAGWKLFPLQLCAPFKNGYCLSVAPDCVAVKGKSIAMLELKVSGNPSSRQFYKERSAQAPFYTFVAKSCMLNVVESGMVMMNGWDEETASIEYWTTPTDLSLLSPPVKKELDHILSSFNEIVMSSSCCHPARAGRWCDWCDVKSKCPLL